MSAWTFPGRLAIQQRVLPTYRMPFFDALAAVCQGGISVFAGLPQADENIPTEGQLQAASLTQARNRQLFKITSPLYRCWQPGFEDWLAAWQPDVLIVEANPRYLSTPGAIAWMHRRGQPVLGWGLGAPTIPIQVRAPGHWLASRRFNDRLRFLSSLDGLIAYSQRGAQEYAALGIPAERIFVAPNAATPPPAWPLPARSPVSSGPLTVLFVGRLQARKRVDHLIRACADLPVDLQPRLCVVGDGPIRQELMRLAAKIYPQAEFPGERRGAALEAYFWEADLFALPGTGGLAVQQAMSYGLPVIVAQGDGTQDDLVRPENGWKIPADDLPALIEILAQALTDLPRLRKMGAASYRIVAEEVNIEQMARVFVQAASSSLGWVLSATSPARSDRD